MKTENIPTIAEAGFSPQANALLEKMGFEANTKISQLPRNHVPYTKYDVSQNVVIEILEKIKPYFINKNRENKLQLQALVESISEVLDNLGGYAPFHGLIFFEEHPKGLRPRLLQYAPLDFPFKQILNDLADDLETGESELEIIHHNKKKGDT